MTHPDLTFRPPTQDDAQAVLDLMCRCEIAEYGEPDSDIEDLLYDWEQIDLSQDAQLAFTPQGKLAGYSAVMPWITNLRYDFFSDPDWENDGLAMRMLAFCLERGPAMAIELGKDPQATAKIYLAHANQRNQTIVEGAGFTAARFHFQMEIQLGAPLSQPEWPAGVALRACEPEADAQEIHALIEAAFARPDRTPTSFEEWQNFMLRADIFDPGLWFLAIAGQRIVGACLGFVYSEIGWVRQLGVAKEWRRKGLGTALLHHAFIEFKRRGFAKAGLTVAGDNPNAYSLYQKAGMQRVRQYDEYEKAIFPDTEPD